MASCFKTTQNTLSLFLLVIYLYIFPLKESVYVFSSLEIKVRRKRTMKHQEEWVRVDKDAKKPRTAGGGGCISPRTLIRRAMRLQKHQDAWGWRMAGTRLGELQTQKSNGFLIKQKSEEINGLWKNKGTIWWLLLGRPLPSAVGNPENPIGSFYHLMAGRGH